MHRSVMAAKLVQRAERQQKTITRQSRQIRDLKAGTPGSAGLTIGGAAAAAYIDRDGGLPEDFFGVPTSAAVGGALATASILWPGMPMREWVGPFGIGMLAGKAYDYVKNS